MSWNKENQSFDPPAEKWRDEEIKRLETRIEELRIRLQNLEFLVKEMFTMGEWGSTKTRRAESMPSPTPFDFGREEAI